MDEDLAIAQADALNSMAILVRLSDGRSLILGLNDILGADFRVLQSAEEDDETTYYPREPS